MLAAFPSKFNLPAFCIPELCRKLHNFRKVEFLRQNAVKQRNST